MCRSDVLPPFLKLLRDSEAEVRVAAASKVASISNLLEPDAVRIPLASKSFNLSATSGAAGDSSPALLWLRLIAVSKLAQCSSVNGMLTTAEVVVPWIHQQCLTVISSILAALHLPISMPECVMCSLSYESLECRFGLRMQKERASPHP